MFFASSYISFIYRKDVAAAQDKVNLQEVISLSIQKEQVTTLALNSYDWHYQYLSTIRSQLTAALVAKEKDLGLCNAGRFIFVLRQYFHEPVAI